MRRCPLCGCELQTSEHGYVCPCCGGKYTDEELEDWRWEEQKDYPVRW